MGSTTVDGLPYPEYPSAVAAGIQRLWFAGANTLSWSESGNYNNFTMLSNSIDISYSNNICL